MRIAATQRVVVSEHGERRDALDQRVARLLAAVGALSLPVPNLVDDLGGWVDELGIDGVLLTGGNDLAAHGGDAPERDATEIDLVRLAGERGLPVVGLCRGLQLLAHLDGVELVRVAGHAGTTHGLVGYRTGRIGSYHDWALSHAPVGAEVLACAEDGTVEALRWPDRRWLGLMWHPEREHPMPAADLALLRDTWSGVGSRA